MSYSCSIVVIKSNLNVWDPPEDHVITAIVYKTTPVPPCTTTHEHQYHYCQQAEMSLEEIDKSAVLISNTGV